MLDCWEMVLWLVAREVRAVLWMINCSSVLVESTQVSLQSPNICKDSMSFGFKFHSKTSVVGLV